MNALKPNSYLKLYTEPCKILSIDHIKPAKHGPAKLRIVAVGLFDQSKRIILISVKTRVKVPIIQKYGAVVSAVMGETLYIMICQIITSLKLICQLMRVFNLNSLMELVSPIGELWIEFGLIEYSPIELSWKFHNHFHLNRSFLS